MHVSTPGWRIAFWLECAGDDGVCVSCPFPLRVPGKPVNEPGDYCSVGQAIGWCQAIVYTARIVFSAPHRDVQHTRRTALCRARMTTMRL